MVTRLDFPADLASSDTFVVPLASTFLEWYAVLGGLSAVAVTASVVLTQQSLSTIEGG